MAFLKYWKYRKKLTVSAGAGVPADSYQLSITTKFASGTDSGATLYLAGKCKTDFSDIRFTSADGETLFAYWLRSKVDSDTAVFWVKIPLNLNSNADIYIYYGNSWAASLSSQIDTFVDVISGIVAAWNLDEPEAEVNPTVIADDNQAAFWAIGSYGTGSYEWTRTNDAATKHDGTDSLSLTRNAGTKATFNMDHDYGAGFVQNWSTKKRVTLWIKGTGSGAIVTLRIYATADLTGYMSISFLDSSSDWRKVILPCSQFIVEAGAPSWSTVRLLRVTNNGNLTQLWIDRIIIDDEITANDYSGNGNNGVITGASYAASKFCGARLFNGTNNFYIKANDSASLDISTALTLHVRVFLNNKNKQQSLMFRDSGSMGDRYWNLWITSTNQVAFRIWDSSDGSHQIATPANAVTNGMWLDIIVTYDGACTRIYVNGINTYTSNPDAFTIKTGDEPVYLGLQLYVGAWYYPLDGILDEAGICNIALTDSQIANLANEGNFGDITLESGKVLVRKYATTTQPAASSWATEESAQAILGGYAVHIQDGSLQHSREPVGAEWDSWLGNMGHVRKQKTYGCIETFIFIIVEDTDLVSGVHSIEYLLATAFNHGTPVRFSFNDPIQNVYDTDYAIRKMHTMYSSNMKARYIAVTIRAL